MRLVLMIFAALLALGLLIGKLKGGGGDTTAKKPAGAIVAALNESYGGPLCVYEGRSPRSARRSACIAARSSMPAWWSGSPRAGLTEAEQRGYDLTAAGMASTTPTSRPPPMARPRPGCALARHGLPRCSRPCRRCASAPSPMCRPASRCRSSIARRSSTRRTSRASSFPWLPLAEGSQVTKPIITTLSFGPNGEFIGADPGFRYGKWLNEK